jgi:hypothetical protein
MPTPKSDFAIETVGRHVYAFLGAPREYPWGGGPFDVYDWVADTWAPTQFLGSDIGGPVAGVLGDRVHVVGGEFAPGPNTVADNEAYDPATNTFESRAPMPTRPGALRARRVQDHGPGLRDAGRRRGVHGAEARAPARGGCVERRRTLTGRSAAARSPARGGRREAGGGGRTVALHRSEGAAAVPAAARGGPCSRRGRCPGRSERGTRCPP